MEYEEITENFSFEEEMRVLQIIVEALRHDNYDKAFNFSPIILDERVDHEDNPYLHVDIIFDGDDDLLSADWTSTLLSRIRPELIKNGLPMVLSKSFIPIHDYEKRGYIRQN